MLPLSGWSYCKKITVQTAYLDAALTDFPLVIFIDGDTGIGSHALATGYDVRFTASDGTTLLSYERRSFVIATGAATGRFVVKTSLATAPATDIYIHYGNAAAPDVSDPVNAYDVSFKRVWALNETYGTGAGNYKDSKGVGNCTLTDADADSAQGAGPIDKAVDLNGDADYLTDADHADHDPGGAMTIEAWINPDVLPASDQGLVHRHEAAGYLSYCLRGKVVHGGDWHPYIQIKTASGYSDATGTTELSAGNLYYFAGVFDKTLGSNRLKIYLQGIVDGQGASYAEDIVAGNVGIAVGSYISTSGGSYYINGKEAEVRYSNVARSAAWIKFVYRNITEADHEQTWGAEEAAGPAIAVVQHHMRMMRGA